jgi:hypothetical protein
VSSFFDNAVVYELKCNCDKYLLVKQIEILQLDIKIHIPEIKILYHTYYTILYY